KKHKNELLKLEADLIKIEKDIEQLQKEIKKEIEKKAKAKKALTKETKNTTIEKTQKNTILKQLITKKPSISNSFEVDWDNIFFKNRKITIRHNNQWYDKYIPESKKFLN